MAQRYMAAIALSRMDDGLCPECGRSPELHSADPRFWVRAPTSCDLRTDGVNDRIEQNRADVTACAARAKGN